jgi:hypothetical protein
MSDPIEDELEHIACIYYLIYFAAVTENLLVEDRLRR